MAIIVIGMQGGSKTEEVDRIVDENIRGGHLDPTTRQESGKREAPLVHTMRAVVIIVDMTKSIGMKDFKPSRLAAAVLAIR